MVLGQPAPVERVLATHRSVPVLGQLAIAHGGNPWLLSWRRAGINSRLAEFPRLSRALGREKNHL
jgi:hypothetical protein